MRFTFRSKKCVLKERDTSVTEFNSQEQQKCYKTPPKYRLTLHDCKYAKFEPRSTKTFHEPEEAMSRCDFKQLWNKTEAITKENRSNHVRLLSAYIMNGPFCSQNKQTLNKLILKPKSRLKLKDVRHCEVMDPLTKCMHKQAKIFHKALLKEVAQQRKNSYHLAWKQLKSRCSASNLLAGQVKKHTSCSRPFEENENQVYGSHPENCSNVADGKSGHGCGHNLPCVEQSINTYSAGVKAFKHELELHNEAKDEFDCDVVQENINTNSQCKMKISHKCSLNKLDHLTEGCSQSSSGEVVANCDTGDTVQSVTREKQPECSKHHTVKISRPKRFGIVNEAHCKVVSNLVTDRLFCRRGEKVRLILQENFSESYELVNLKLYLAQTCLDSFFFPCFDSVRVSIHQDLHKYLEKYIFKTDKKIKDVFGERHDIDDRFDVDFLILVPATYTGLFRHDDLCFLDSLSIILGYRKDRLLVMKQSAEDT